MANTSLPVPAIRAQIVSAVDLIIQVERMRDGVRRIVEVTEVVGREGDIITLANLFSFRYLGETTDGRVKGVFDSSGTRPGFYSRLDYHGYGEAFLALLGGSGGSR
jgi:pilus assembly protein CpaF